MKLAARFYKEPYGNVDEEKVAAEIDRLRTLLGSCQMHHSDIIELLEYTVELYEHIKKALTDTDVSRP